MLRRCIKTYEGYVENGAFRERILTSWLNDTARSTNYTLDPDIESDRILLHPPSSAFQKTKQVGFAFSRNARVSFTAGIDGGITSGNPTLGEDYSVSDTFARSYGTGNISHSIENIALVATKVLRELPSDGQANATGITRRADTYIKVRWRWLAFPLALEGITLVFLLLTIMKSRMADMENWKSSSLAIFRCGLLGDGDFKLTEPSHFHEIENVAAGVHVVSRYPGSGYAVAHV